MRIREGAETIDGRIIFLAVENQTPTVSQMCVCVCVCMCFRHICIRMCVVALLRFIFQCYRILSTSLERRRWDEWYSRRNSTKSPASAVGSVNESRLMSQVRKVREHQCVSAIRTVQVLPVFVCLGSS